MKRILDSYVQSKEIRPPLGRFKYEAKMITFYEDGSRSTSSVHWGETREEAETKARRAVDFIPGSD